MKGAANRRESNLSRIPPCPGIIFDESLIFIERFHIDSTRSPSCPKMEQPKAIDKT